MSQLLANIHPDAKIADNVTIEPFATVQGDVEIGEGCWIGPNAVIMDGARLGKNCRIFPGAVVAALPQDLKFAGEVTTAVIGDNTVIRECVTISRGTADRYHTQIGENCLLMAYVHVAHDCVVGNNVVLSNAVQVAGHVHIGDYAVMGGKSAIHQFVRIGPHVMLRGGSLVSKDIPPYVTAGKEPVSFFGVNAVGLRRRDFTTEQINDLHEIYRIIYQGGLNISRALEKIEADVSSTPERDLILDFIRNSERGIIRGNGNESVEYAQN